MESFAFPDSGFNGDLVTMDKEQALLLEFSKFLRKYLLAKECFLHEQLLDAYSSIESALHHWARIVILEQGELPEVTLWEQAKRVNPGVYKMYEELMFSSETIEQRIQLILLACEFAVMSKMELCCEPLLRLLRSRQQGWTIEELQSQPALGGLPIDWGQLLGKMVQKSLIHRLSLGTDSLTEEAEIRYVK
ncbi:hypothetical protein J31TS4_44070 [Paenibacillus sp. J31TS4]|uniref:hypothetical protein n=1 Tax=Paenibacillus sp. J31TS4 TaxID=2807195 RepID=UPI001B177955|nr:hypothetical protein [Paenibacillus sp. J31TS4]GIP41127.1 hypothetical protein J31TS4_44070 [Paenibacillus sp. J31TS4]